MQRERVDALAPNRRRRDDPRCIRVGGLEDAARLHTGVEDTACRVVRQ